MRYSILEMISIFFVYGFMGWCVEVIFAASNQGKFVNRGFLFGPICPIYAMGMLAVLLVLEPLKENLVVLYIGSVVITSLLELLVGMLANALLHQRLWDYSDEPLNIKGYICLKFSLLWGVGAMTIVCVIHPVIMKALDIVPDWLKIVEACVFGAMIITDCVLTLVEALKIPKRMKALQEMERLITDVSVHIGENLTDGTLKVRDGQEQMEKKREEARERILEYKKQLGEHGASFTTRRLTKAFPSLGKTKYTERLEHVRELYEEFINGRWKDRM